MDTEFTKMPVEKLEAQTVITVNLSVVWLGLFRMVLRARVESWVQTDSSEKGSCWSCQGKCASGLLQLWPGCPGLPGLP